MAKNSEKPKRIEVAAAKGRPMLSWVGKRPLRHIQALPAQHVETFDPSGDLAQIKPRTTWLDWPSEYPKSGLLFHGDNKEVLSHLIAGGFRGRVNLIYIDPPFDSGADYVRKVALRGVNKLSSVDSETYSLAEQIQYTDIWANDNYLQFMFDRLILLRELLADNGSIFLHCDWRKCHHLRMLMDEVFGEKGFVNEVVWLAEGGGASGIRFGRKHQTLLYYTKSASDSERIFNADAVRVPYKTENISPQTYHFESNQKQRPGFKEGYTWTPNEAGKVPTDAWMDLFMAESEGIPLDVWYDVKGLYGPSGELENYPTQKPLALLRRVVLACSNPGDLVLDCFAGSGTTLATAQMLGRRWIGCDINKGAIQTTSKRLQAIIKAQSTHGGSHQRSLIDCDEAPDPTQASLCVYSVNGYDLQVQHNEAVRIACEYIGVETKRSDSYFEGTLGKTLVKIVPFNHPLSPVDLDDLKQELETRKDEDRDITLVCLGMEVAARAWVDEWNRLRRKSGNVPNRIRVIELRTDPNYAGFLKHDPATAKVKVSRSKSNGKVSVVVEDFISPTIIKRLDMEQGLFQKKVKDWRSMVDCVMIDPAYDGHVFDVALSDVPETKNDLVAGEYEVAGPDGKGKTTVAVKIIDMLGEEVLVTKEV